MIADLSLGCLALLLLIVPGWWMAHVRGLPVPIFAGFIFGDLVLLGLIQFFSAIHVELSLKNLVMAWAIVAILAIFTHRGKFAPKERAVESRLEFNHALLLLPLIPAIAVVAYRATAQPLSGVDTIFRWNFLAEQMLERRTLEFYPPVTGADYSIYAWPDGIAPVVSAGYFWVYAFGGEARAALTAPFVVAQFLILLVALYHLGKRITSSEGAALGCALAACSPILLWAVAMGQESGLLTLALVGLLLYLPDDTAPPSIAGVVVAGMAAALGGLAREYGLTFIVLGIGIGVIRRLPWRVLGVFLFTAVGFVAPWYLRNWFRTGNPLFNLSLGGLFPVNHAQQSLMSVYESSFGWAHLPSEAPRNLAVNCVAIFFVATASLFCIRVTRFLWAGFLLMVVLWAVSVSYTAAGFTYSLRVLAPGLAVISVGGGVALARLLQKRAVLYGVSFACLLLSLDSALRALTLPANVYKVPPSRWLTIGGFLAEYNRRPVYQQVADFTSGRPVLTLGPAALINRFGAHSIPPWSPEVSFLWDRTLSAGQIAHQLNARGISLVLLSKGELNVQYLSHSRFFDGAHAMYLQPIWEDEEMTLYRVITPR